MAPTTRRCTSSRLIRAGNLSPEAFAPYGQVVQNPATHNGSPRHVRRTQANQGSATKWLDVTHMQNLYEGRAQSGETAKCVVNMFVCEPRRLVRDGEGKEVLFPARILERHPFTPQMFVPMGVAADDETVRYLVIVAPTLPSEASSSSSSSSSASSSPSSHETSGTIRKGSGPPDLDNIQAFIARGGQAVTYGPGTWHAPMVVLGSRPIEFVVVQYANGVALEDCQEVEIGVNDEGTGLVVDVSGARRSKARL